MIADKIYFSLISFSGLWQHIRSIIRGPGSSQIFSSWVQHVIKNWTQSDLRFSKKRGQKVLRLIKMGVIGSKIKGKIDTKYLKTHK